MAKLTKAALGRKKPVEDELLIPADDQQAEKLEAAKQKLSDAEQRLSLDRIGGVEDVSAAEKAIADAEAGIEAVKAEIRKTGVAITLRGVGRVRWD